MNKKYIVWIIVILVVLAGGVLAVKFWPGGDGNNWIGNYWLCRNGQWEKMGQPSEPMPTSGCGIGNQTSVPSESSGAQIANPASVYCAEHGGTLEIRTDATGGQSGVCKFSDGSECEEWQYMRGECKMGDSKNQ